MATLIEAGANMRAIDRQGNTVLHLAAGYGRSTVCDLLRPHLSAADAQQPNNAGQTPADVARLNGHDVSVLLKGLVHIT